MTTTAGCCSSSRRRAERRKWGVGGRHLFVLLFVLGLVAVSAVVIANKETKLGLDLKGGLELVYQGRPTGTAAEVIGKTSKTVDRHHPRTAATSSASPSPKSRGSATDQITVSLPGVTDAGNAAEQVGTTAQLYFYDWEPNLIGRERDDRRPPGRAAAGEARSKKPKRNGKKPGRKPKQPREPAADLRRRLPERLRGGQARRRTGSRSKTATTARARRPRYYLFEKDKRTSCSPAPSSPKRTSTSAPTGRKAPARTRAKCRRSPAGDDRSSPNSRRTRKRRNARRNAEPGWFALKDDPALSGTEITNPKQEYAAKAANRTSPSNSPTKAATPSTKSPARSPSAARRRRSGRPATKKPKRSPATSRSSSTTKSRRGRSSTSPKTPTGSTAAPGPRSPAASTASAKRRNWPTTLQIGALPINLKLISETQVSATLGSAGAPRRDQGRDHRPRPRRPLPAPLLPLPRA